MKTTLECSERLRPNVELRIVERDEAGVMVGHWRGYWDDKRETVALYPASNPNCTWRVPRVKHKVSDRIVRYAPPRVVKPMPPAVTIPPPVKRRTSPFPGKDAKPVLIEGQYEMEII